MVVPESEDWREEFKLADGEASIVGSAGVPLFWILVASRGRESSFGEVAAGCCLFISFG
jgi:hypothetical protein